MKQSEVPVGHSALAATLVRPSDLTHSMSRYTVQLAHAGDSRAVLSRGTVWPLVGHRRAKFCKLKQKYLGAHKIRILIILMVESC